MSNSDCVLPLASCRDNNLVGGKALNLGKLVQAGFPVPDGFAVTTGAYRHARHSGDDGIPPEVRSQILDAYKRMGSPPVAVRSSATAEDMAEASMAGQYETYLDVRGDDALLEAVRKCWASVDSPRTRAYLEEHGIAPENVAMAVVIQRLVAADVAGVLFTLNPQTASQEMVVEASWGLGEAVVSGIVQPDVLHIDRDSGSVSSANISDKQVRIEPGGTHAPREVEADRRRKPCLSPTDVDRLWKLGLRAAAFFGSEQDLEWAIHDGELFLLQSRNITTLDVARAGRELLERTKAGLREELAAGCKGWVLHNLAETLSHPTPLTWSVIRRFMSGSGGFGNMYRTAGFRPAASLCESGFLKRIAGRVYMDLSRAPEMFCENFPFEYDVQALRNDPNAGQMPPTLPSGGIGARIRGGRRTAAATAKMNELAATLDQELDDRVIPEFVAWCEAEKRKDIAALGTEEWLELWERRERKVLDEFASMSLLPSLIVGMALEDLKTLIRTCFWNRDPEVVANQLAVSERPDRTMQANIDLYQVATNRMTPQDWLVSHGHRATDEFDLAAPRWRETPDQLQDMAGHLKDGANPAMIHAEHVDAARALAAELRNELGRGERRGWDKHLDRVRRYIRFREDGKHYLMLGYDLLRDMALEASRRLGVDDDGVFLLSVDELRHALTTGYAPLAQMERAKIQRRAEARMVLPHLIDASAIDSLGDPPNIEGGGRMTAFAVSSGAAQGPARIVHAPQDAKDLGRGYVLVCPSTDPSWTPLFVNAAGLVLECGGTLSHGAVVAREMGIPAVVLANATRIIEEGEQITVDGQGGAILRGGETEDDASPAGPGPDDERVAASRIPPPPAKGEQGSATIRNLFLVAWTIILLLFFLLPPAGLKDPCMSGLDWLLWPLVVGIGRPGTVAIFAAFFAVAIMIGQRLLTDNRRLLEVKRRVGDLQKEVKSLPKDAPRTKRLLAFTRGGRARVTAAAFVPLAVAIGPLVISFIWLMERMDPATWNAAPGTTVQVQAFVDSDWRETVTLQVAEPLYLDETFPARRSLPPVRETLEDLRQRWQKAGDLKDLPWDVQAAAQETRKRMLADLNAYLQAGVPPESLVWTVHCRADANNGFPSGRFPIAVVADDERLELAVVLGDETPPTATEATGAPAGILRSLKIVYPLPKEKRIFCQPLAGLGWSLKLGWLWVYLLIYLPLMYLTKWLARVP